jgi:hypothetical protein
MALTFMCGFEAQAMSVDGGDGLSVTVQLNGTSSYSTAQHRTGAASIRCNPASGASGYVSATDTPNYVHFGFYVATLPSVDRRIFGGAPQAGRITVRLTSAGTLTLYDNVTLVGTSSAAFASPGWHWVGIRQVTGTSVTFLQIDGVNEITGTVTISSVWGSIAGFVGTEASAADAYVDDMISDSAGLLQPSNVALLVPISDNARATLWVAGAAGTTNLWDAVNNKPPAGVASASETNTTNIEHDGGAAGTTDAYDANLTTYATAGVNSGDTVLAVQSIIRHGEDIATGTKNLAFGLTSNPSESLSANFTAGGDAGAHGAEAGLWVTKTNALITSPSVTVGSSPILRVTRPETASRVACVDFMGLIVAWTPAAVAASQPTYNEPYQQLVTQ